MAATPSTADFKHLLREHLLADASLAALVGTNVYGARVEDADAQTLLQDTPLAVFESLSGNLRWHGAVATATIELYGYSKRNSIEASSVYDAIADSLQTECLKISGIGVTAIGREAQRPLDGYNTSLGAWFVRGRWVFEVV